MRKSLSFVLVITSLIVFDIIKLTESAATCDQTDQNILECFSCSDSADSSKCTNATGADILTEEQSLKSSSGDKNVTRCYGIIQGEKIINRGLMSEADCEATATAGSAAIKLVKALKTSLGDSTITYKCCPWSCCNYNMSSIVLDSAPDLNNPATSLHGQTQSDGMFWQRSLETLIFTIIPLIISYF